MLPIFLVPKTDRDECCLGTYCDTDSSCENSLGGFLCTCNDGFTGNGTSCEGEFIILGLLSQSHKIFNDYFKTIVNFSYFGVL